MKILKISILLCWNLLVIGTALNAQNGTLCWYKHDGYATGTVQWQGGFNAIVGTGWDVFKQIIPTSSGVMYGVKANGDLVWYKHTGYLNGKVTWQGGLEHVVGTGWNIFDKIFAGNNGVLYGLKPNGDLYWYKHLGYLDGSVRWEGGLSHQVGNGWNQFTKVFCMPNGVFYGVKQNGELAWYKHLGFNDGSVRWAGGLEHIVGNGGWNVFTQILTTSNGVIYGVKPNGDLAWYKHLGFNNGTVRWEGGLEHIVGNGGWTTFSKIFSMPNGVIYGVKNE